MVDFSYLYRGVCGLANAHRVGTLAGHLGAAVAAGYFFGEDQNALPEGVFRGVESELDRIIQGEEAIWFNAKKAGLTPSQLFDPLPKESADANVDRIAETLAQNIAKTRQSGHNVIFASIALRALKDHHEYATRSIVDGVCKLTAGFNGVHSGRGYYGKEQGWKSGNQVGIKPDKNFPVYTSIPEMVETTLDELIRTASVHKQGFGGLWHIINHAAGVVELEQYGYRDLALQGLPAHHQHVQLWRTLPDVEDELGPVVKSSHDPREPVYWQGMLKRDQARLTHRIKTLYGFYTLRRYIENDARRAQAEDAFLYLMA